MKKPEFPSGVVRVDDVGIDVGIEIVIILVILFLLF